MIIIYNGLTGTIPYKYCTEVKELMDKYNIMFKDNPTIIKNEIFINFKGNINNFKCFNEEMNSKCYWR